MTRAHTDTEMLLDAAVGVAAATAGAVSRSARALASATEPLARAVWRPPLVPEQYSPRALVGRLADRGRPDRAVLEEAVTDALHVLVPRVLDAVLDEVDLTRLVVDRVDIDAVVAQADIDAVIARIDLIVLAETIIDGVNLPEIIRESTGSIASEGIRGVRMQTIDADERINRLVDRVLLRRQARTTDAPVPQQRDALPPMNGETP